MSPSAETVKIIKCLPKLTLKKATENADKSDNRQIFATPVGKGNAENKFPKLILREVFTTPQITGDIKQSEAALYSIRVNLPCYVAMPF